MESFKCSIEVDEGCDRNCEDCEYYGDCNMCIHYNECDFGNTACQDD